MPGDFDTTRISIHHALPLAQKLPYLRRTHTASQVLPIRTTRCDSPPSVLLELHDALDGTPLLESLPHVRA